MCCSVCVSCFDKELSWKGGGGDKNVSSSCFVQAVGESIENDIKKNL